MKVLSLEASTHSEVGDSRHSSAFDYLGNRFPESPPGGPRILPGRQVCWVSSNMVGSSLRAHQISSETTAPTVLLQSLTAFSLPTCVTAQALPHLLQDL